MDFREAKQRQERGYTVNEALNDAKNGDYDEVVIVSRKGSAIDLFYSIESSLETIGMLEVAKELILESMNE